MAETRCINTSSMAKSNYTPSVTGGGILLCSFCVAYMQKDRKEQQYLQTAKSLKTRINKGKAPVSRLKLGLLFWWTRRDMLTGFTHT